MIGDVTCREGVVWDRPVPGAGANLLVELGGAGVERAWDDLPRDQQVLWTTFGGSGMFEPWTKRNSTQ